MGFIAKALFPSSRFHVLVLQDAFFYYYILVRSSGILPQSTFFEHYFLLNTSNGRARSPMQLRGLLLEALVAPYTEVPLPSPSKGPGGQLTRCQSIPRSCLGRAGCSPSRCKSAAGMSWSCWVAQARPAFLLPDLGTSNYLISLLFSQAQYANC